MPAKMIEDWKKQWRWEMTVPAAGAAVLTAAQIPNFFSGALPSGMTMRRFGAEDADRDQLLRDLNLATVAAGLFSIGTSFVFASPWPAIAGGVTIAGWRRFYLSRINDPHPDAMPINHPDNLARSGG